MMNRHLGPVRRDLLHHAARGVGLVDGIAAGIPGERGMGEPKYKSRVRYFISFTLWVLRSQPGNLSDRGGRCVLIEPVKKAAQVALRIHDRNSLGMPQVSRHVAEVVHGILGQKTGADQMV